LLYRYTTTFLLLSAKIKIGTFDGGSDKNVIEGRTVCQQNISSESLDGGCFSKVVNDFLGIKKVSNYKDFVKGLLAKHSFRQSVATLTSNTSTANVVWTNLQRTRMK